MGAGLQGGLNDRPSLNGLTPRSWIIQKPTTCSTIREIARCLWNADLDCSVHKIHPLIHINFFYCFQWLYSPLFDLDRFFSFLILYLAGRLPWTGISPSQQHNTNRINANRYPCFGCDSNQRSQCLSGPRQFMPQIARPLWTAHMNLIQIHDFHAVVHNLEQTEQINKSFGTRNKVAVMKRCCIQII